jgi:nicotinate-nucleotide adenylyltransferase
LSPGTPRRIGLFGGSFDPPHLAHRALADIALRALALDELRWLPAGQPWQKAGRRLAEPAHRAAMVALAAEGEPRFVLDERELHRAGPSYTIDTVRELRREQPGAELFLVIGQDQYARLPTWQAWRELVDAVTLAVAARDGIAPQADEALAAVPHRLAVLPLPRLDISATDIRARTAAGQPIDALVGAPVARYISDHHLYGSAARP